MYGNKISSCVHEGNDNINLDNGLETIINNLLYKLLLENLKSNSIPIQAFDDKWDVSEIDFKKISHIFMSIACLLLIKCLLNSR